MRVYFLRHGIAADRDAGKFPNDEERPLTEEGIEKMCDAAQGIARLIDPPDLILTSPLVRAAQTADIVAKSLNCKDHLESSDTLRPGGTVRIVREMLTVRAVQGIGSVLLVGHEPDLGKIASGLIGAKGSAVEFKKGSLCAIQLDEDHIDRTGVLLWHLTPGQLRAIGKTS